MTTITLPWIRSVATWTHRGATYRVRAIHYPDGADGLLIEIFGPGSGQRSVVVRGDVRGVSPPGGWRGAADVNRSAVVEALFEPPVWP